MKASKLALLICVFFIIAWKLLKKYSTPTLSR
jgi:hypothetical protein